MSKLKSNFIYNAIYQILILIIPLITTPYVARTIGAEGVGTYSYTYSIVLYFMMFALLGMNNYGNREVSKVRDDKEKLNRTFSSIYYLQLIVTLIVSIIYIIYVLLNSREYFTIQIIHVLYLVSVAFDINWLFCGLQKFKMTVTRSAILKILNLVLILIFVKDTEDLNKYIFILAFMTLLNQLILWPFRKKEVSFIRVSRKEIFKHLKPTIILFIPVLASSVYRTMDKIMIGKMANMSEVGYYENAEKMLNIVLSVINALGTVTLPQMTYLYSKENLEEFKRIFKKSISFVFFSVFPVIFGFLATADILVLLYLGEGFTESAVLLKVLSISLIFTSVASIIRMQLLIPRGKDKEYTTSILIGAIVNFIFNMIFIRRYGAIGATIGTILAEFLVCFFQCMAIRKDINLKEYLPSCLKFFITSLVMFIIVYFVGKNMEKTLLTLVIQVTLGVFIYCILNYKYIKSQIAMFINRKKGVVNNE